MAERCHGHLLAGQGFQLHLQFTEHVVCHLLAIGEEYALRVHAMFCLTEHICRHIARMACHVGHDGHLGRSGRHVYGHIGHAHLLLGAGNKLIARTEYLAHLGHRLRTVCHGAYCLDASALIYAVHSCHTGGIEYGGVQFALWRRGRAEDYVRASCYLGRGGKHQHGAEQGCRAAGYVESHPFYCHRLLPAVHAWGGFHADGLHALGLVEAVYVGMGKAYGLLQFVGDEVLCLLDLLFAYGERGEANLVKLLLVAQNGRVAFPAHVMQHSCHYGAQVCGILVGALEQGCIVFPTGV